MSEEETLLEFPCDFSIKVMGPARVELDLTVVEIVRRHAPDLSESAVTVRDSRNGNYISVTVVVRATSKGQLDSIYRELTAHEHVMMAL